MEFLPLYFEKELIQINPKGDLGILTLWSRPQWVLEQLEAAKIDLSPTSSRIAAIGTLYGNGIPQLIRNLLYNPQICYLMVGGRDRSGSKSEIFNFFQEGVETVECLGNPSHQIKKTTRKVDTAISPEQFLRSPTLRDAGDFEVETVQNLFQNLPPKDEEQELQRLEVPLPKISAQTKPSNLRGHSILKETPLEGWKELVFRAYHFGREVQLKKGKRRELQNVKVILENPQEESVEALQKYNFDPVYLKEYQKQFIAEPLPEDTEYTYGNRLQGYYGFSTLLRCGELLKADPECRTAYVALWDTKTDLGGSTHPCLVSLFFRAEGSRLNLTATFRTHNIMDAWLPNVYGLMHVLEQVRKIAGMEKGALTIFSQSISIDAEKLEEAKAIAGQKKNQIELDPAGDFKVGIDGKEIVVTHLYQGILVKEYRSVKAQALQHQLAKDQAIFDLNHALYLGRQLANAEWCIKTDHPFVED